MIRKSTVSVHSVEWTTLQSVSRRAKMKFWMGCSQINSNSTNLVCYSDFYFRLLRLESALRSPSSSVRDLSVYISADLSIRTHIAKTSAGCYTALHQIRNVLLSLPPSAIKTLVVLIVLSRLDCGYATLTSIPAYLLHRPCSTLQQESSLACCTQRTSAWRLPTVLHWLRATECIKYGLATLKFHCLQGLAPHYVPLSSELGSSLHSTVFRARLLTTFHCLQCSAAHYVPLSSVLGSSLRSTVFSARLLTMFLPTSHDLLMCSFVDVFARAQLMVSSFDNSSKSVIVHFQSQTCGKVFLTNSMLLTAVTTFFLAST